MKKDSLNIKWVPRKVNLDVSSLDDLSPLYEAETLEDIQLEFFHKKGTKLNINHSIVTEKYGNLIFISPNPVEFYLYGAKVALDKVSNHKIVIEKGLFKNNILFFEMISFLIYQYSALEAFLNQKIPKHFKYEKKPGLFIGKEEIEKNLSIEDKIKFIFKLEVSSIEYWVDILKFIQLRHKVTHLKTAIEESDFRSYDYIYKELLDFNYQESFEHAKKLMREVNDKAN